MSFARNEKHPKNGLKLFCPSTKSVVKRAKTIMVVRYKNQTDRVETK